MDAKANKIKSAINKMISQEEMREFTIRRLESLKKKEEDLPSPKYPSIFRHFIGGAIEFKDMENVDDYNLYLISNHITPYLDLVKKINYRPYTELRLFYDVYSIVNDYFKEENNCDTVVTMAKNNEKVCPKETAILAHNLFKFLGIDSDFVTGYRDGEKHSYNILYPKGYDKEPMVIYDPTNSVHFTEKEHVYILSYFKALGKDEFDEFMSGKNIKFDLKGTEVIYRHCYNLKGWFYKTESSYQLDTALLKDNNKPKIKKLK